MRTLAPVLIVLVLGVSGSMLSMAGFAGAWGVSDPGIGAASDQVNEQADDLAPANSSATGPVTSGESSIVGLVVDSSQSIVSVAGSVMLLPITIMQLGFPAWFAVPIGSLAYLIAGIGVVEFATNREWT